MTAPNQRTITRDATLEGVGVHSGQPARLTLRPADPGHGIAFRRTDLDDETVVPADLDHVVGTEWGTSLALGDSGIRTVEHVLAALVGSGIDNVLVEVDGPECPIMDGSFEPYRAAIEEAGPVEQNESADMLTLDRPVHYDGGGGSIYVAAPAEALTVATAIDFDHPSIGRSFGSFECDPVAFAAQIARARTFGFEADAEDLRERGFALGSSNENTIVLGSDAVASDALRFDDEFVRHKTGDLLGDLALLGGRLSAAVVAQRPGHAGNVAFARAVRTAVRRGGAPAVDITRIMDFLPHRYPMLLVDRILDYTPGKEIVGVKNVTINEPFFQGHFPGHPIMPGVLILEAMAQCGGLLMMDEIDDEADKVVYFMTMDDVKFRRPVTPGDQLVFEMKVLQMRRGVCRIAGRGVVDGHTVAEAEFKARLMDR